MQLDLGSHVRTSDGKDAGKVDRIIFETDTMMVREFVVHKGILFGTDRIVDREQIDHIGDEHEVYLKLTAEQAADLPAFIHDQHFPAMTGDYLDPGVVVLTSFEGSVPRDAVVLSHRSEVYDSEDKHIGHLDEIVYGHDGRSTAFIVDSGFIFTHDVTVPIAAVKSITHNRIDLSITADEADEASRG